MYILLNANYLCWLSPLTSILLQNLLDCRKIRGRFKKKKRREKDVVNCPMLMCQNETGGRKWEAQCSRASGCECNTREEQPGSARDSPGNGSMGQRWRGWLREFPGRQEWREGLLKRDILAGSMWVFIHALLPVCVNWVTNVQGPVTNRFWEKWCSWSPISISLCHLPRDL